MIFNKDDIKNLFIENDDKENVQNSRKKREIVQDGSTLEDILNLILYNETMTEIFISDTITLLNKSALNKVVSSKK